MRANVGKWVCVRSDEGVAARLWLLHVDDEGCTCRVADHPDYSAGKTYWWNIHEIAEIQPCLEDRDSHPPDLHE
jgi:hypothetical protein